LSGGDCRQEGQDSSQSELLTHGETSRAATKAAGPNQL
jgi:hypothetical protein